ncbi:MAG: DUF1289 domain-containing protein [Pseudomonadales bacterium]
MTRLKRRTPCIGICSTTYGDLVCRGCKRFAHEIFDWNRYSDAQQEDVISRLRDLKASVVAGFVEIVDRDACVAALAEQWQSGDELLLAVYDYLVQARSAQSARPSLNAAVRLAVGIESVAALRRAVDEEFLARSKAVYERNFKVLVD